MTLTLCFGKTRCAICTRSAHYARLGGEMAEWFKAHAWKACVAKHYRGFKSHSLRQLSFVSLAEDPVIQKPPGSFTNRIKAVSPKCIWGVCLMVSKQRQP